MPGCALAWELAVDRRGSSAVNILLIIIALAVVGYFVYQALATKPEPYKPVPTSTPTTELKPTPTEPPAEPDKTPPVATRTQGETPPPTGQAGKPTEIAGFVRDVQGQPVAGATVQLIDYEAIREMVSTRPMWDRFNEKTLQQTTTDDRGEYRFTGLVPAEIKYVKAVAMGFIPQVKDAVKVGLLVDFNLLAGAPVEVVVTDADTKAPISDALVKGYFKATGTSDVNRVFRWDERRRTNEQGKILFDGVPAGKVLWLYHHDEYRRAQEEQSVELGKTNVINLSMKKGIEIHGQILNKFDEKPIAGALVQVTNSLIPEKGVRTDANGLFVVKGLETGPQFFSMTADGFTDDRLSNPLSESDHFDPAKGNLLKFRLEPTGNAAGICLDPEGNPVANAKIFVAVNAMIFNKIRGEPEFVTKDDGKFFVKNLGTKSAYFIAVQKDGYGIGVSQEIKVGPGEIRDSVEVRLRRGCGIRGQVTNELGAPIPGAVVTIQVPGMSDVWFPPGMGHGQASTQTFVTGDDGRYDLSGVWKGSYTFGIEHPQHVGLTNQRVEIREVDQGATQDFTLKIGRFIAGRVVGPDGRPAEGALVTASFGWSTRPQGTATVDQAGNYRIPGLVQGQYRVQARKDELSSRPTMNVPADSSSVDFQLLENGGVAGVVISPTGTPVTEFTAVLSYRGDPTAAGPRLASNTEMVSDPGGRFLLQNIDPGDYQLTVTAPGFARAVVDLVTVPSGSVQDIGAVRLPRGGIIRGVVKTPQGQAIQDVMITAFNSTDPAAPRAKMDKEATQASEDGEKDGGDGSSVNQRQWSARPDAEGKYELNGLNPGTYILKVESSRYVVPQVEQVPVANDVEIVRDYSLAVSGSLTITLTDDFSEPVVACIATVRDLATGKLVGTPGPSPRSDAQGKIVLTGLPPGRLKISLNRTGYIVKENEVDLAEGQSSAQAVQLQKLLN